MEYRSIVSIREKCTACGACVNICARKCIELRYDKEGFLMPEVDVEKCTNCGMCEKACHIFTTNKPKPYSDFNAYAGWTKSEKIRFDSSSGGIFSMLSQHVLNSCGVVFGAAYNYELKRLEHCSTDSCDISELRKSKYIESNTLSTYSEVGEYLKEGRKVLYCGTPCQISGLKQYLSVKKIDRSNLLLVDFICHGVPSTMFHAQWLQHLEKKSLKKSITYIDFRSKRRGWMPISMAYKSNLGREVNIPYYYDNFYLLFLSNNTLRRSCYNCEMIHYHLSDITIADFWGRKGIVKDDNKGISLAIINSSKGKQAFRCIDGDNVEFIKLEPEQYQYAYKERSSENFSLLKRAETYQQIDTIGFVKTLKKLYGRDIAILKIKNTIKDIIGWKRQ